MQCSRKVKLYVPAQVVKTESERIAEKETCTNNGQRNKHN